MTQIISGGLSSTLGTASSLTVIDVPSPGVLGPTVVNNYTVLSVSAYWRAMQFRSANMASFPRSVRKDGVSVPHRLDKLLNRRPNDYQSPTMLFRTWHFAHAHYANGFIEIERDALYNPKAMHNRPPEWVTPFRILEDDGSVSQWYHVGGPRPHIVANADMMHLSSLSYDGMAGLNPVWIHGETYERARLLDRYITRFLVKGSVVRGSISLPAGQTDDQIEAVVNQIRKFRGADAEEDLLVVSGGGSFSNNTTSNDQSKIIELVNLSTKQVAQLTDVDPYWLFDKTESKYTGDPSQSGEDVVRYLFRLLIEQAEDELLKLLSEAEQDAGYTVHIDPCALLRGNVVAEAALATQLVGAGILSKNEGRQTIGKPPSDDPDADTLNALGNTAPQQAVSAPETPVKAAADQPHKATFAALKPLFDAAAERIEAKTDNAFSRKADKPTADRTIWANVFAGEQAAYVIDALRPVAETLTRLTGETIDIQGIAERYSAAIRKRASDGTITTAYTIINEGINHA
jgi:HK97 family phage portal protein